MAGLGAYDAWDDDDDLAMEPDSDTDDASMDDYLTGGGYEGDGSDWGVQSPPGGFMPVPQMQGYQTSPTRQAAIDRLLSAGSGNRDMWMALANAGFGAAASGSPYPMQAFGQGGLQGLKYLQQADAQNAQRMMRGIGLQQQEDALMERSRAAQANEAYRQQSIGFNERKFNQAQANSERNAALAERKLNETVRQFNVGRATKDMVEKARVDLLRAQAKWYGERGAAGGPGGGGARMQAVRQIQVDNPGISFEEAYQRTFASKPSMTYNQALVSAQRDAKMIPDEAWNAYDDPDGARQNYIENLIMKRMQGAGVGQQRPGTMAQAAPAQRQGWATPGAAAGPLADQPAETQEDQTAAPPDIRTPPDPGKNAPVLRIDSSSAGERAKARDAVQEADLAIENINRILGKGVTIGTSGVGGALQRGYNATLGAVTGEVLDKSDVALMNDLRLIKTQLQKAMKTDSNMSKDERKDLEGVADNLDISKGKEDVEGSLQAARAYLDRRRAYIKTERLKSPTKTQYGNETEGAAGAKVQRWTKDKNGNPVPVK